MRLCAPVCVHGFMYMCGCDQTLLEGVSRVYACEHTVDPWTPGESGGGVSVVQGRPQTCDCTGVCWDRAWSECWQLVWGRASVKVKGLMGACDPERCVYVPLCQRGAPFPPPSQTALPKWVAGFK